MSWLSNLWSGVTSSFEKAGNWVNDNIIKPVGTGLEVAKNAVNDYVIKPVSQGIQVAGNAVKENVIEPVSQGMQVAGNAVKDNVIEPVSQGMQVAGNAVKDNVIEPVSQGMQVAGNAVKEILTPKEQEQQNTETFNPNGNSNPTQESEIQETPQQQAQSMLERAWEREDKIRKETQEREDNAYQRAVADMRKAGINPNLVGINPANSGGGITSATMPEKTLSAQISAYSNQLIAELARELELNENKKDRLTDILGRGLSGLASIIAFK